MLRQDSGNVKLLLSDPVSAPGIKKHLYQRYRCLISIKKNYLITISFMALAVLPVVMTVK